MIRAPLRAIALVTALSTASCSWIVMRTAPDPPVRSEPNCTTSRLPPFVDLYFGIPTALVGLVVFALASTGVDGEEQDQFQLAGGTVLAVGGLFLWSGSSGLGMARECRDAEAEYEEWVNNRPSRQPERNPWARPPVRPGAEGGMCAPGNTCEAGLTCASGFCVRLP